MLLYKFPLVLQYKPLRGATYWPIQTDHPNEPPPICTVPPSFDGFKWSEPLDRWLILLFYMKMLDLWITDECVRILWPLLPSKVYCFFRLHDMLKEI